jgi:hypothetical protein
MRIERKILFGKKAKHNHWGIRKSIQGGYPMGGYELYIYGIEGLFNIIIRESWGNMMWREWQE